MKNIIVFVLALICTYSYSQEFHLEVEYSSGVRDTVIFGFADDASLGIDSNYNEVNIFGTPLQSSDLRSIQRVEDLDSACQYENNYDENIDSKINIRPFSLGNIKSRSFEFILTTQDTNFNISLKGPNLFVDGFISFEPDTCETPDFPPRFRIEENLVEVDLKPLMRFEGLSNVNYIVFLFDQLGVTNTNETKSSEISVTPNPASHFVNVSNDQNNIQEISILTLDGKTIQKEKGYNNKLISIKLPRDLQGLYLIRVKQDNNHILTQKLYVD